LEIIAGLEICAVVVAEPWVSSYGTIDCGMELMSEAWKTLNHKFAVRDQAESNWHSKGTSEAEMAHGPRYSMKILDRWPVDVLVVELLLIDPPTAAPWTDGKLSYQTLPSRIARWWFWKFAPPMPRLGREARQASLVLLVGIPWATVLDIAE
jgi:hypothetical protein